MPTRDYEARFFGTSHCREGQRRSPKFEGEMYYISERRTLKLPKIGASNSMSGDSKHFLTILSLSRICNHPTTPRSHLLTTILYHANPQRSRADGAYEIVIMTLKKRSKYVNKQATELLSMDKIEASSQACKSERIKKRSNTLVSSLRKL